MSGNLKIRRLFSVIALALTVVTIFAFAFQAFAMTNRPLPGQDITPPAAPDDKITPRAIGVEPLPENEYNIVSEKPTPQSAALFIGVNNFSEDNGLASLNYAVNDAIEQAYVFVHELKLIKPQNCILCLSGDPATPLVARQLKLLKQSGVEVTSATKPKILQSLHLVNRLGQSRQDIVVVSFSTHGFESKNGVYLMPKDGLRGFLDDTAIYSGTVKESMSKSIAGKKLLILDACRERIENTKSSGSGAPMSRKFQHAFAASSGFATLMSCSAGQYSYEDKQSSHGVFSTFLLKALRGESPADERGFITVGSISEYVSANVGRWVLRNKPEVPTDRIPTPALAGAEIARRIPLAIGKKLTDQQIQKARVEYINYYPPVEPVVNNTAPKTDSRCVVVINNSKAALRSMMTTELKQTFQKASLNDFEFIEESSPLDTKSIARHLQTARRDHTETLVMCAVETADQGEKESYGSKFSYYDASITVSVYDVNTQKRLHNFTASATRGSSFSSKAQQDAVTYAAKKIAPMLLKWFKDNSRT